MTEVILDHPGQFPQESENITNLELQTAYSGLHS